MLTDDCFTCWGVVTANSKQFHPHGFIKSQSKLNCDHQHKCQSQEVDLFGKTYSFADAISNIHVLFDLTRKSFMLLNSKSRERGIETVEKDFTSKLREDVSTFLNFVLYCVKSETTSEFIAILEEHLQSLRLLFHKLSLARLPEHILADYASSHRLNQCDPAAPLVHCHLDFRWLYIKILRTLEDRNAANSAGHTQTQTGTPSICTEEEIMHLMNELIWLAIVRYEKADKNCLSSIPTFACLCVKELWLLLVHFPYPSQDFWTYFNETLRVVLDTKTASNDGMYDSLKVQPPEYLPCSNRNEFALWLLADISRLVEFDSEGCYIGPNKVQCEGLTIVDDILKQITADADGDVSEQSMRNILPLVARIQAANEHSRNAPILLLCEYFCKKINSVFYVPGSKLNTTIVASKTVKGFLDDLKSRLEGGSGREKRENSFLMFLKLIGDHVKFNLRNNISSVRLCSRVFVKFSNRPEKYMELLESGICHLSMLYLTLALTSKTPSIVIRLLELLVAIPIRNDTTDRKHEMIWKGYGASLLVLSELRGDLMEASSLVLTQVDCCMSRPCLSLLTFFLEALEVLFGGEVATIKGIHYLLAPWITNYNSLSRKNEKARVLQVFIKLLQRLLDSPGTSELQSLRSKTEQLIIPILSSNESPLGAELAALSALNSNRRKSEIFRNWSDHRDVALSGTFLATILQRGGPHAHASFPQLSSCIRKVLVRCCFFWGENAVVDVLWQSVPQMQLIPPIKLELTSSPKFKAFLKSFNIEYGACQTLFDKGALRSLFLSFFEKFDTIFKIKFEDLERADAVTVARLYDYCGEIMAKCPRFVYSSSDPHCLFKLIVDRLLLMHHIYNPHHKIMEHVLAAVIISLPRFIQGFFALNPDNDAYIGRILRDTLNVYLPRLQNVPVETHPIAVLLNSSDHTSQTLTALFPLLTAKDLILVSAVLKILTVEVEKTQPSFVIIDNCTPILINALVSMEAASPIEMKIITFFNVTLKIARNRFSRKLCCDFRERLVNLLCENCRHHIIRYPKGWVRAIKRLAPLCRLELSRLQQVATNVVAQLNADRNVQSDSNLKRLLEFLAVAIGVE